MTVLVALIGPTALAGVATHVSVAPLAPAHPLDWYATQNPLVQPPTRQSGGMAYEAAIHEYILFGGASNSGTAYGDTWAFSHGTWTDLTAHLSAAPSARWYFGMTWDPSLNAILLFGGRNSVSDFHDTWEFNGSWHLQSTPVAPPPMTTSRLIYDAADGYALLFGGYSIMAHAPSMYDSTWTFGAHGWTNITANVTGAPPDVHVTTYGVYDSAAKYVLFFGGSLQYAANCSDPGFTWTYVHGTYTNLSGTLSVAPPLGGAGSRMMAPDAALNGVLLYGGWGGLSCRSFSHQTWSFVNGSWHQLIRPYNPGPLWDGAMASDGPGGTSVLLFSGNTVVGGARQLNETWTFRS